MQPGATDPAALYVNWCTAILTLLAILVALFKEELTLLWRRPRLKATISLTPPHCTKTPYFVNDPESSQQKSVECYFFRLWVENIGNNRANNVQVYAAQLFKKHADGRFKEVEGFLPMNLRWANNLNPSDPAVFEDLNPKMGYHCDLAHIIDPQHADLVGNRLPNTKLA
jgi:hypothetical protein